MRKPVSSMCLTGAARIRSHSFVAKSRNREARARLEAEKAATLFAAEQVERTAAIAAEKKAERDARYAARKTDKKVRRRGH